MQNFEIYFSYPWLLLLLVAAVVLTLIPYFRLAKRYRRTRNRITSIVLHLIVMVLAITTLAGLTFHYQIPNEQNELILLVDVSETEETSKEQREELIQILLNDCEKSDVKVGIVTFGFDQEYALPLTYELEDAYDTYLDANLPDTSATNIAAALEYAKGLFENPETAKIVLITDGKETDEEATSVIGGISAQGTKVDVAYVGSSYEGNDVQLIGVELPDYHVNVNEECLIKISVQSDVSTTATIELYDNDEVNAETGVQTVNINAGTQTITFKHTFTSEGIHELKFKISLDGDLLQENNVYSSYLYLEVFNDILVLERRVGESVGIETVLNLNNDLPYHLDVKTVTDDEIPMTIDRLRLYDQVILNNIANKDLPDGFDILLQEYVSVYGGGLFTVGGNDDLGAANAYNRQDMYNTLYQEMLPVQAINYTPPVGVMVVIDRSGSMGGSDNYGQSKLDWAKAGAVACLNALSERDYIGVMTLDNEQSTVLEMTPRTQGTKIREAINSIEDTSGGTVFPEAIQGAGIALRALGDKVARKHIILVTDGEVGDDQAEAYEGYIQAFYETDGITLSVVGVDMVKGSTAYEKMKHAAVDLGHGRVYAVKASELLDTMRDDLNAPEIEEVNYEEFKPIVNDLSSSLVQGLERGEEWERNRLNVTLDGFYGVKVKADAELILTGDYQVPLYAQWKYGQGMVGSFMCDLGGVWSSEFINNETGQGFIRNVVDNLMPTKNIRPSEIGYVLKEDNYINKLSIYTQFEAGETIKGELIEIVDGQEVPMSLNTVTAGEAAELRTSPAYVTLALTEGNNYSRCDFVVRESGTYKIVLKKYDKDGNIVMRNGEEVKVEFFKSFAYSEEYDTFESGTAEIIDGLKKIADKGNGAMIEDLKDPHEALEGFVLAIDKTFDPRFLFMILVIILFLADIAVRKFKFKWPHELIRDYKNKKKSK